MGLKSLVLLKSVQDDAGIQNSEKQIQGKNFSPRLSSVMTVVCELLQLEFSSLKNSVDYGSLLHMKLVNQAFSKS